jgi:hypothetical protein
MSSANSAAYHSGSDSIDIHRSWNAFDRFVNSRRLAIVPLIGAIFIMLVPAAGILIFIIIFLVTWINHNKLVSLPLYAPMSGKQKNIDELDAGGKIRRNTGISYLGVCRDTNRQAWSDSDLDRTHRLIIGTTGSGKTVAIVSFILFSSFIQGGGFFCLDGKGDKPFVYDIVRFARRFLRQADLFILDFATGRDVYERSTNFISNQINLITQGSSSDLAELVKGMSEGEADVWKQRADMWTDLSFKLLYFYMDRHNEVGTLSGFTQHLDLRYFISRFLDPKLQSDNGGKIVRAGATDFLKTLPGLDFSQLDKINSNDTKLTGDTMNQWGYVVMSVAPALSLMTRQYWHIFDTKSLSDIDIEDAFIGNRILFGLLPALQKSESSLRAIGKLLVGLTQGMYGKLMPDMLEGEFVNLKEIKATNAPYFYQVIYDEGGYYLASGADKQQAQLRSLQISVSVCAQNYGQLEKSGEDLAEGIWGSSNNKFFGKVEDSDKTFSKIQSRTGKKEQWVSKRREVSYSNSGRARYAASKEVSLEERDVVSIRDMAGLKEGEFLYLVGGDRIINLKTPFVNPPTVKFIRTNIYMPMSPPIVKPLSPEFLRFRKSLGHFLRNGITQDEVDNYLDSADVLTDVLVAIDKLDHSNMMESGLVAMNERLSNSVLRSEVTIDVSLLNRLYGKPSLSDNILDTGTQDDSVDPYGDHSLDPEIVNQDVDSIGSEQGIDSNLVDQNIYSDEGGIEIEEIDMAVETIDYYKSLGVSAIDDEDDLDDYDDSDGTITQLSSQGALNFHEVLPGPVVVNASDLETKDSAAVSIDDLIAESTGSSADPLLIAATLVGIKPTISPLASLNKPIDHPPVGLLPDRAKSVIEALARKLASDRDDDDEFDLTNLP